MASKFDLKGLNTLLSKSVAERQIVVEEGIMIQKKLTDLNDKIKNLKIRIAKIKQVNTDPITEHAVVRYVERVMGIDINAIKKELTQYAKPIIDLESGGTKVKINEHTFLITVRNGQVVTIVNTKKKKT